jgi:hypothetical protein
MSCGRSQGLGNCVADAAAKVLEALQPEAIPGRTWFVCGGYVTSHLPLRTLVLAS